MFGEYIWDFCTVHSDWLIDWWIFNSLIIWLIDWLIDYLIVRLIDWWIFDWLIVWLIDWSMFDLRLISDRHFLLHFWFSAVCAWKLWWWALNLSRVWRTTTLLVWSKPETVSPFLTIAHRDFTDCFCTAGLMNRQRGRTSRRSNFFCCKFLSFFPFFLFCMHKVLSFDVNFNPVISLLFHRDICDNDAKQHGQISGMENSYGTMSSEVECDGCDQPPPKVMSLYVRIIFHSFLYRFFSSFFLFFLQFSFLIFLFFIFYCIFIFFSVLFNFDFDFFCYYLFCSFLFIIFYIIIFYIIIFT